VTRGLSCTAAAAGTRRVVDRILGAASHSEHTELPFGRTLRS
jgi:hypothetical protein